MASGDVPSRLAQLDSSQFYVDGNLIMCGKEVFLPEICVTTGQTDDLVAVRKKLSFAPGWIFVFHECDLFADSRRVFVLYVPMTSAPNGRR